MMRLREFRRRAASQDWHWHGVRAVAALCVAIAMLSMVPMAPAVHAQAAPTVVRFPHDKHDKLFPQCAGCHAGIPTGDRVTSFPDSAMCGQCHNGRDKKKVAWLAPTRTPSNLRFAHDTHRQQTGEAGAQCQSCHAAPDAKWMHVERAKPAQCQGCHTHRTSGHLAAETRCSTCHVPLTKATELSVARISAFPKPETHQRADFAEKHGAIANLVPQCATCHARESCARCHVNAADFEARFNLAPDPRVATLILMAGNLATYGVPASHASATFRKAHGAMARANVQSCANCHARASCLACHTGSGGAEIVAQIPLAEPGGPTGARLKSNTLLTTRALPWRLTPNDPVPAGALAIGRAKIERGARKDTTPKAVVHPEGYSRNHGVQASASQPSCDGCHTRSYCAECHAGESSRRFHPINFVGRHAPDAWGREVDCQQCHNREVFCRGCHIQVGLSSKGRSNVGYHSAVPLWTLQHGQAARQNLASCTTCHAQKDCMQCHAQGGRGINPHGPGFDARRMWKANRLTCLRCHFKDPLSGG